MSLSRLGNIAVGYSASMDNVAQRIKDPELVNDPGKLAQFNIEMYQATTGYQLAVRAIQDIHREDQMLSEMLRDA